MLTRKLPCLPTAIGRDSRGIAMTEFALSLPVVLALALGGLEVTNIALAHLRVSQIATTTADNAGRVMTQMDETDIDEIFAGADAVGQSIAIDRNGRVVLSSIQDNGRPGNGRGQMIGWQRCKGAKNKAPAYGRENAGRNDASLRDGVGPPGRKIIAPIGSAVMFVEVTYDYQSLITNNLIGPLEIRYESAFPVRERTELGITNTRGRPVKSC